MSAGEKTRGRPLALILFLLAGACVFALCLVGAVATLMGRSVSTALLDALVLCDVAMIALAFVSLLADREEWE